jgi:hypothetical protein
LVFESGEDESFCYDDSGMGSDLSAFSASGSQKIIELWGRAPGLIQSLRPSSAFLDNKNINISLLHIKERSFRIILTN